MSYFYILVREHAIYQLHSKLILLKLLHLKHIGLRSNTKWNVAVFENKNAINITVTKLHSP